MGKLRKTNTKCNQCDHVVGKKLSMYAHLKKKHGIKGPGTLEEYCTPTSSLPTTPHGKRKKKDKKDIKKDVHKFSGFRSLDLFCNMPPNKGDKVIVVTVDIEINLTRGTNRIISK